MSSQSASLNNSPLLGHLVGDDIDPVELEAIDPPEPLRGLTGSRGRLTMFLKSQARFGPLTNPKASAVGIRKADAWQIARCFLTPLPRAEELGPFGLWEGYHMTTSDLPRTCARCRGSMIVERDWYGAYSTCLCCGYVHEAVSTPTIDLMEEEEGHPRQRRRQPSHGKLRL